jgi:L-lactate dehydrogenase complex protein LldF
MSSAEFRAHIRSAIDNAQLQTALDANAERRVRGRAAAFASLPDWRERRRRAHAVRARAVDGLQDLLHAFTERATENGMRVHRAANAAEAIGRVLEIAEGTNGRSPTSRFLARGMKPLLFAKSKSMLSEEIELNTGLENRGHRVVETDLGEYIVQLRGEKPAHIITPAVHLQRHQVGELFQEKLGLPYTDDIPALTAAARSALREVFLTADVGVSGVNFGVADTGTVCIVTNEGNGRMVTTMPRMHIALMGMERLVWNLDDLALMLSLLPRAATGQKLSVYTQLIHSPRRAGETDGAAERHIIIVDNGRSRLLDSQLREALYCIRCGACLNACPVFREIGGHAYVGTDGGPAPYPGPIGSVISPGLGGLSAFGHLSQASSLCGACKDACPVDIDLPKLLTRVRAGSPERSAADAVTGLSGLSRLGLEAYAMIAASASLFAMMQRLAAIGARMLYPTSEWMHLPAITGWGSSKHFPRPAARPFRTRWRGGLQPTEGSSIPMERVERSREDIDSVTTKPHEQAQSALQSGSDYAVQRFIDELELLGAEARRVARGQLQRELLGQLRQRSMDAVLIWNTIEGVSNAALEAAGVRLVHGSDPSLKGGITGCDCAIANTGTLVISSTRGRPLSASLLPETHIAIVHAGQILASMEEALRLRAVREAATTVLITGPSRTADIEMTLTIGVHGPKELVVYIVE